MSSPVDHVRIRTFRILDTDYSYDVPLTITNNNSTTLPSGYSVSYTFNHASLVGAGKALADGADVSIAYWNGSAWVELDRALDLSSSWDTSTTKIWFKTQVSISGNGTDQNYYLYYGDSSATIPSYDPHSATTTNAAYNTLIPTATTLLATDDHTFFPDLTDYWKAAPSYIYAFAADTWYAFTGFSSEFTAAQIKNFYTKFIAAKNGSGDFPIALNGDGTAFAYYSAWDDLDHHATGDGDFFVPQMEKLYYDKSGDISNFASTESSLKTALANIPRDGTTKLVSVTLGDEWVPWGFQDMVRSTGDVLMGSLLYYQASVDMAALYTVEGDGTDASFFTNEANNIKNNLYNLWDSTDGMFYAGTGQNHQIDIDGSAYALYLGAIPAASSTAISDYLVTNYSTLTSGGYIRQSPTDWASCYYINGPVCSYGSGEYDNGRWSVANEWVLDALARTSPSQAAQYATDFSNNADKTMEYYGIDADNGFTNNLESPMGTLQGIADASN